MNKQPLVSIIINCYNSEKYLAETIDSVFAQIYDNFEVIFWDNQSTDNTAQIIASYSDAKIQYHYAENHTTLGEARNLAMKNAKGEYLTFLDSDDVWLPEFLKNAVYIMETENCILYYSNYFNWIKGKSAKLNYSDKDRGLQTFGDLLTIYHVGMSAAVFNYKVVNENEIKFNKQYQLIEDYDFFLNLVRYGNAYYDPRPLMKYRMHQASLTNNSKKNWSIEFDALYKDLTTGVLDEDQQSKYSHQLKWLKVRAINARAEEYICDGNRIYLIGLILRNIFLSAKLLFPLFYLFLSRDNYYKLKAKIKESSYHV